MIASPKVETVGEVTFVVEETLISFQLDAHDKHERIARGVHKLRVIRVARFAERVRSKLRS